MSPERTTVPPPLTRGSEIEGRRLLGLLRDEFGPLAPWNEQSEVTQRKYAQAAVRMMAGEEGVPRP